MKVKNILLSLVQDPEATLMLVIGLLTSVVVMYPTWLFFKCIGLL